MLTLPPSGLPITTAYKTSPLVVKRMSLAVKFGPRPRGGLPAVSLAVASFLTDGPSP
jgi:hypothetical protein